MRGTSRYDELVDELRRAAKPELDAPEQMHAYLDKVRLHAYKVTDRDVEELKGAGFSEDEIFEHTVSAAVAAGLERLDAGLGTLG
jgi:alkylhydroperoxidase family enzyme